LPNGWARRLWLKEDMRNLVKDRYPWFLETYDNFEQDINRIYAARIFFMHQYGGVYADLDTEVIKDPTPLFAGDYDLIFFYQKAPKFRNLHVVDHPKAGTMGAVTNSLLASVSGHPFWLFVAQKMVKASKEVAGLREQLYHTAGWGYKFKDVLWTTGTSMLTDALAEYQEKFPETSVGIFSQKYWSPWRSNSGKEDECEGLKDCTEKYPEAYIVHHWTGSWNHCTPGTCLPKPSTGLKQKVRKRKMPPPPPLDDSAFAMPPSPPLLPAGGVALAEPAASAAAADLTTPAVEPVAGAALRGIAVPPVTVASAAADAEPAAETEEVAAS